MGEVLEGGAGCCRIGKTAGVVEEVIEGEAGCRRIGEGAGGVHDVQGSAGGAHKVRQLRVYLRVEV